MSRRHLRTALFLLAGGCQGPDAAQPSGGTDVTVTDPNRPDCATDYEFCSLENPCDFPRNPEMLPGADCLMCHRGGPDAPLDADAWWTAAGTVYSGPLGGARLEQATVRITGADGAVLELISNSVGNFYTSAPIALPFRAEIEVGGAVIAMVTDQTDGSCNTCHACEGAAGGKLHGP